MIALLKKDWRMNLAPRLGGICILSCLYLVAAGYVIVNRDAWGTEPRAEIGQFAAAMGMLGLWLTTLIAATYGGVAFAAERRERWANFLAVLPINRSQIVFSKALLAAAELFVLWLINAIVFLLGASVSGMLTHRNYYPDYWPEIRMTAALVFMAFAIAWLFSTFLTSAAIAACVAIGFEVASVCVIASIIYRRRDRQIRADELMIYISTWWGLLTGIAAFLIGTIYYLFRRVEP